MWYLHEQYGKCNVLAKQLLEEAINQKVDKAQKNNINTKTRSCKIYEKNLKQNSIHFLKKL